MDEVEIVPEVVEDKQDNRLPIAVAVIAVVVIAFFFLSSKPYDPGMDVDQQTFLEFFSDSQNVIIFMDVRGVSDPLIRQNIFQCGVDFAGSTGLVTKNTTYFSLGEVGCVTPLGENTDEYCYDRMKDAMVIYIKSGEETTYHQKGMMVGINSDYDVPCGIHSG